MGRDEALFDSFCVLHEHPVVAPRGSRDGECQLGFEALLRRAHGLLLGIAPAIPRPLDRALDQLEPFRVLACNGRGRKGEHLPSPVLPDHRHQRLTARPAGVPVRPGMVRVGGHDSLLHREDEVVSGGERGGRDGRIAPPEPDLKRADRLTQRGRRLARVAEPQRLDLLQQKVRFGKQRFTGCITRVVSRNSGLGHIEEDSLAGAFVN